MEEPQSPQAGTKQSSVGGPGEGSSGWRSQVSKGVQSRLSSAKSLLSTSASSGRQDAEGASSPPQEQSWKRRIAGISAHLKAPFTHESIASSQGIVVSEEVQAAVREGRAVVALESTIISHGMPFPQNLETALAVEEVVRSNGAVPATVAIIGGTPHVGLSPELLERIAKGGQNVKKTSRRDLASVMARGVDGATTVSATMLLAARAGISVFVTGGIGGVHRGGENSWDVSSDLTEFSKTPMAVVCAGAKSILDIPRTLEFLETQGISVAAFQAEEFPAFFTPHSGCAAPCRVDTPQEAAKMIKASQQLDLGAGLLFGVPIPEQYAAEGQEIEGAIRRSLREAEEKQVSGAGTTPFLLQRIQQLTGGKSLAANIHLIKNNATVGSQIACALAQAT